MPTVPAPGLVAHKCVDDMGAELHDGLLYVAYNTLPLIDEGSIDSLKDPDIVGMQASSGMVSICITSPPQTESPYVSTCTKVVFAAAVH